MSIEEINELTKKVRNDNMEQAEQAAKTE